MKRLIFAIAALSLVGTSFLSAQGTAFTYQGRLNDAAGPANGTYDFRFSLHPAASGTAAVGTLAFGTAGVNNGIFSVQLDFGAGAFDGTARWLEVAVRTNGTAADYVTLTPRQPITATPYALVAGEVTSANVARLDVPNTARQATGAPTVTSGFITSATVTDAGLGYTTAPAVTVNDSAGSGAVVSATISEGKVTGLTVHNAGSGYSAGATLTIAPPPHNAYQYFSSTNYFTSVNSITNANNVFAGSGSGLTGLNASQLTTGTISSARISSDIARTNQVWMLNGNALTTPGVNYVGTKDNQPLHFHVNGARALRLEPGSTPNFIAGAADNQIIAPAYGSTIGGGLSHYVLESHATIGGGSSNSIFDVHGTIGGGTLNDVYGGPAGTVGGGRLNRAAGHYTTVAGGHRNTAVGFTGIIGGGQDNLIETNADHSVIAGGLNNTIERATFRGTIAGGADNTLGINAFASAILGGRLNSVMSNSQYSVILGGLGNEIRTNSWYTLIGGGFQNHVERDSTYAMILGGYQNRIGTNSGRSVILGGIGNVIGSSTSTATIGGGEGNDILDQSPFSLIAGGFINAIHTNNQAATISGGQQNQIGGNSDYAKVGGGINNNIRGASGSAIIAGGSSNDIHTNSGGAVISGGFDNTISPESPSAVIGGGEVNRIGTNSFYSVIGGGANNVIGSDSEISTISGGQAHTIGNNSRYTVVAGGYDAAIGNNSSYSTVLGGGQNIIADNATYAVVVGGNNNFATNRAFAAGTRAKANHSASFVWADVSGGDLVSTNGNSVTMRAIGGYRLFTSLGGAGAYLAGGGGAWTSMSDRNAKENVAPVDPRAVLEKVAALPVSTWNYKTQTNSVRHIGPMAQDFKAAFNVGESETGITTIDADGVALAAIQGLNEKLKDKQAEIDELKRRLAKVEEFLAR